MVANDSNPVNDAKYDSTFVYGDAIAEKEEARKLNREEIMQTLNSSQGLQNLMRKEYGVYGASGRRVHQHQNLPVGVYFLVPGNSEGKAAKVVVAR